MLELDPRIDRTKIKSIVNADDSLVGKIGYYTGLIKGFKDLSSSQSHGKIKEILSDAYCDDNIFIIDDDNDGLVYGKYFIADEDLLPPAEKYAQFRTIDQFLEYFTIGDIIKFRRKGYTYNYEKSMLTGVKFIDCCCYAYIANDIYTFTELFNDYELYLDDTIGWIPFGVKVHG